MRLLKTQKAHAALLQVGKWHTIGQLISFLVNEKHSLKSGEKKNSFKNLKRWFNSSNPSIPLYSVLLYLVKKGPVFINYILFYQKNLPVDKNRKVL